MAEDDGAEKSHEPSQRKLDDARKKGEIPRSPDMLTAAAYLGMLLTGLAVGGNTILQFGEALLPLIERLERLTPLFFNGAAAAPHGSILAAVLEPILPWLAAPAVAVLLTLFATRTLVFTGSKLSPKANRLSPIENAKNKFGRRGLF